MGDCLQIARRAAAALKGTRLTPSKRLKICSALLRADIEDIRLHRLSVALASLPDDHRHYWIGTFYTLLLPKEQRRRQSAYFTRPEIARHLIKRLEEQGTDFSSARVLDPAAGGAAFLSLIAGRMKELGCSNKGILSRLRGIEIDPELAALSRLLIADRLGLDDVPEYVIKVGDALAHVTDRKFDVVLCNPPYGRVSPERFRVEQWSSVCHPGHVNLYAMFVEFCLRQTRGGGRCGFVIPSSFIAGPLYCKLRAAIRERGKVRLIGHVECREEFFVDVLQDVSLLVVERRSAKEDAGTRPADPAVSFGRIDTSGSWSSAASFALPSDITGGWVLPSTKDTARGGAILADYGCRVSAGYFVWNRETERMRKKPLKRGQWVPLFWACNIRANARCRPKAKDGLGTDFVKFDEPSPAIIKGPSILLQRTTNTKQRRRLIAGFVEPRAESAGGYVTENHTIVVRPTDKSADLELVCRLLNSAAVDRRYRQISGTASISTLLLRSLDLPQPEALRLAVAETADFEAAVELAYGVSRDAKLGRAA
jgi:adenine-specific DNA-methyltransferase